MDSYIIKFQEVDKTKQEVAGGKGANLGELSRIEGIHVPEGFCVTSNAFRRVLEELPEAEVLLDQLCALKIEDRDEIAERSGELRRMITETSMPEDIREGIVRVLKAFGEEKAYAVRSSATAEDLPTASFAGQMDTYLNVIGIDAVLKHVSKCWASLFTERAITYRIQNGYDHRIVQLAVVVQKMIFPQASGILFTADPITSNRTVVSINAGFGLGEALVSGLVSPDLYNVCNGKIIHKEISNKKLKVSALQEGGIKEYELPPDKQNLQVLTDEQILELEQLGRKIESHFGRPQDIEWCLEDNVFHVVQSRPITTLYPVPEAGDQEKHVYVSVGHQQMMTDPMKPLGLSIFELTSFGPRFRAGGRLFIDVAPMLASSEARGTLLYNMGQHDPLIKDALDTLIHRGDFIEPLPEEQKEQGKKVTPDIFESPISSDPASVAELIRQSQESIKLLRQSIQEKSGAELFDFIREDIENMKNSFTSPQAMGVIITAANAASWLNEKMEEWLGEKSVSDTLSQSVPNNITAEMGLDLLNLADAIRPYPEVIAYLQQGDSDHFLDELLKVNGGKEARAAILSYLDRYGMRCAGEIDITRLRWGENPSALIPMILSNMKNFAPEEGKRRFEKGRKQAIEKEKEIMERLKQLPDGKQKAEETKKVIDYLHNLTGYREYPKYEIVQRYFIYKQALLKEADQLKKAGIINDLEDIYYLTFDEFRELVRTKTLDLSVITDRRSEFKLFEKLTPPRVITSDGEIVAGTYQQEGLPSGAIPGLAVSAGIAEGRARVILNMEDARLEEGDILVTTFTDPSWTPLFVAVKGLITEVGGLMTHGAVIAREYGLPAVVGVENAVKLIKDGQRIRINGTEGFVEIID